MDCWEEEEKANGGTTDLVLLSGFEGLSVSADGKTLYALLQAAANQEGVSALRADFPSFGWDI